ncbi:AAA family ATPase [Pontibaca methylaminivorans]|uniref:MoxR-like ATPase n=1 Tax=Pontibaca methylaminivorans TaxID=515897 RepID=A0A1R3WHT0_9RHOB|nr:MoxR family ATPase [Pontibaca methylaminivorans]SIT77402.1 MoxR-like ATPase [Pontibaca methylaminivorans]
MSDKDDPATDDWRQRFRAAEAELGHIILGQQRVIRLLLLSVLARGHVLLAGDVGTGKTTLLRAMARALGGPFARIEGTVDLLPSDLIYDAHLDDQGRPLIEPGPVLSRGEDLAVFFFNEINRARPQVHALLLRLMAEQSLTAFRREHRFPHLQVFADRNQIERDETFELPAAARDRFMLEIEVGLPQTREDRIALAFDTRFHDTDSLISHVTEGSLPYRGLNGLAREVQDRVHASEALQRYVFDLCDALRDPGAAGLSIEGADAERLVRGGVSPRGMQSLVRVARAAAWIEGRDMVLPQDVRAVFQPVMAHRTFLNPAYEPRRELLVPALISAAFDAIPVPAQ